MSNQPYKKSAKDLVFEKERNKLNKQIKLAQEQADKDAALISDLKNQIDNLTNKVADLQKILDELDSIPKEDLQQYIKNANKKQENIDKLNSLFGIMSNINNFYRGEFQ